MSFKSREKKRRAKAAQSSSQREQRSRYAERHYLTIVSRAACCNHGGERLRKGDDCVYRFEPKEILCLNCATVLGSSTGLRCGGSANAGSPTDRGRRLVGDG